jgi:hypothetical protein
MTTSARMRNTHSVQDSAQFHLAPSTLRTRRWREREKNGRILLRLELDEAALVVGLVDRNLLDPLVADERGAIATAAAKALKIFCDAGDTSQRDAAIRDKLTIALLLARLKEKARAGKSGRQSPPGRRRRRGAE